MFPPIQCSKSSYFTQWLISEYLNRINNDKDLQPQGCSSPTSHSSSSSSSSSSNSSSFSAKNLKHLFTHVSSHHHKESSKVKNNNEYKNGQLDNVPSTKNIEFIQLLALNALEFTAPIYSSFKKEQVEKKEVACRCPSTRSFVQLSGHPGSFAPAGPNTVWKKMPEDLCGAVCGRQQVGSGIGMNGSLRELLQALNSDDATKLSSFSSTPLLESSSTNQSIPITVFFNSSSSSSASSSTAPNNLLPPQIYQIPTHLLPNETQVYRRVNATTDPIQAIIPKYVTETCYNSQMFLELEDLLTNFSKPNPTIMDIKLGTRTFLESEVKNNKPRPDLYQKLIAVDRNACTEQEHEAQAVTKLTYMLFREKQSSSNSLGFRVEGVKIGNAGAYPPELQLKANLKVLNDEHEILKIFKQFCKGERKLVLQFCKRLEFIRETLEKSEFFMTHEVIGSSLLFIHDDEHVGVWLIDFAKTFLVQTKLTHRDKWVMGNREDGVLTGVDNIVRLFRKLL